MQFFLLYLALFPRWDNNKQNFKKFLVQGQGQDLDLAWGQSSNAGLLLYIDLWAISQLRESVILENKYITRVAGGLVVVETGHIDSLERV